MPHQVEIEPKGTYLQARVTGDNTPEDVEAYLSKVRDACLAHHCQRLLIEEHLLGASIGTFLVFDIVSRPSLEARNTIRRIAHVDTNVAHQRPAMRFAETVALNRGLNVKLFSTVSEAERWLASEADEASG